MEAIKAIKYIYLCLTVLAVLVAASTTLSLWDLLPGICLMWTLYLSFAFGNQIAKRTNSLAGNLLYIAQIEGTSSKSFIFKHKFIFGCLALCFSYAITYFYTGQTILSTIQNTLKGVNLYSLYQTHYREHNIVVFSINKLPFIFMNFGLDFLLIYSYIGILNKKISKPTIQEIIYLTTLAFSFLIFGFARGTNFEVFEFTLLILFLMLLKKKNGSTMKKIPIKTIILIALTCVLAVAAFYVVISIRMPAKPYYTVSQEMCYDPNDILSRLLPDLAYMITRLSQYFTFGIFYTSTFISKVWISSPIVFMGGAFPFGLNLAGITPVTSTINQIIDQSSNWIPDVIGFWSSLGLMGELVLVFFLGNMSKKLENKSDIVSMMGVYLITLQMFSFPIGNFLIVSSANKLITVTVIGILVLRKLSILKDGLLCRKK